jgi:hypothetical protein
VLPSEAAAEYAARGWLVLPCHHLVGGGCSCRAADCSSPGKHPRVPRGLHAASADAAVVERWWRRWPQANVGVRTGAESGLVVVDVDTVHGGGRSMRGLMDRYGDLRDVPRVRTGSGGWHLLFAHPGERVPNSAGRLGTGIDVRGDGGYVIAPPSVHARGRAYRWEVYAGDLPPLPEWLHDLMTASREPAVPSRSVLVGGEVGDSSGWVRAAVDGEARAVRGAAKGVRNATLNRSAFSLGQIVGAGLLDAAEAEHVLVDSAVAVGLGEREAVLTTRSGLRAGLDHPRGPVERPLANRPVEVDFSVEIV